MKREDVCFLMVQTRRLIEASAAPERYRVAAFYADWTVHTALDRSAVCFDVLRDITAVIARNMNPTSPDLTSQISRIIGFPQLRAEFITLFRENGLPVVMFEYHENWKNFVTSLLWHVAGQPIGFPADAKGRAKAVRDEMLTHNIAVEGLAIVDHAGSYHWCLHVSGDKILKIMGTVDLGEAPEAFPPLPKS